MMMMMGPGVGWWWWTEGWRREREREYRKTWRSKEHTHTRAKKDGRTERITKSEKKKKKRIIIIIYWIAIDASDFRISTQFRTTTVNRSVPSISIGGQIWFWFIFFFSFYFLKNSRRNEKNQKEKGDDDSAWVSIVYVLEPVCIELASTYTTRTHMQNSTHTHNNCAGGDEIIKIRKTKKKSQRPWIRTAKRAEFKRVRKLDRVSLSLSDPRWCNPVTTEPTQIIKWKIKIKKSERTQLGKRKKGKKKSFRFIGWPLVACTCKRGWSYFQSPAGNIIFYFFSYFKRGRIVGLCAGWENFFSFL